MLPAFLKQPVTRDTATRPAGDVFRRLCLLLQLLSAVLAPLLGALALIQRDEGKLRFAAVSAALAILLFFTRRFWREPAAGNTAAPVAATPAAAPSPAAPARRPRILILNASLAGPSGNSARLLALLAPRLAPHADLEHAALAGPAAATFATLAPALQAADAFVFATGTHWDSWSSPLQKFLEDATPAEATALWLGKPAVVLVTEHSTGGKGVLSRLQGVLVTLGCTIPPLGGLVLSHAAQIARENTPAGGAADDLWRPADLDLVAHNLLAAASAPRPAYRAWPVDRADFDKPWLKA
jgi:chromate reductase